jgi:CRISPR system Cascade subunit CasD
LDLVADCEPGDPRAELVRDEPLSFDPGHRQWEWRSVLRHTPVSVENPAYVGDRHQPLGVL